MMTKPLVGHGFHHFLPSFKSNLCDSGLRRSLCAQSWGSRWSHHTVMGSEMIRPYWVTYELSMFQWPWAKPFFCPIFGQDHVYKLCKGSIFGPGGFVVIFGLCRVEAFTALLRVKGKPLDPMVLGISAERGCWKKRLLFKVPIIDVLSPTRHFWWPTFPWFP